MDMFEFFTVIAVSMHYPFIPVRNGGMAGHHRQIGFDQFPSCSDEETDFDDVGGPVLGQL